MLASFATAGAAFTDQDKITYTEAVEVLTALGVINGYKNEDGTYRFNPTGSVTRGAMAKMVAYVANGSEPAAHFASSAVLMFDDVAATGATTPSIGYVVSKGYVDGYVDGTFRPGNSVSGLAAAKMLLRALGFDGVYTGTGWDVNVINDGDDAGLFEGMDDVDMTKPLTREAAAQMVFNALFYSEAVSAKTVYTIECTTTAHGTTHTTATGIDTVNGKQFSTFAEAYLIASQAVASGETYNIKEGTSYTYTDSLSEKVFGLSVNTTTASDAFMRPITSYSSTKTAYEAVNYVEIPVEADYIIEDAISEKALYAQVGYKVAGYTWTDYTDGVNGTATAAPNKTTVSAYGDTANGTVMYVYVDHVSEAVTTCLINTYIGEVKKVTPAYEATPRYVTLMDGKTFVTDDFAKNDVVLYTYSSKQVGTPAADAGVQTLELAETVSGTLTKVVTGADTVFTVDGVEYVANGKAVSTLSAASLTKPVTFYVDGNGNIMQVKGAAETANNYILVLANSAAKTTTTYQTGVATTVEVYGLDVAGNVITLEAAVIDNETMSDVTANKSGVVNVLYTYKQNPTTGLYELTEVTGATVAADIAVNATEITYNTNAKAINNSATTYIFFEQTSATNLTVKTVEVKVGNANIGVAINAFKDGDETGVTPAYAAVELGVAKYVFVNRAYAADTTATQEVVWVDESTETSTTTSEAGKSVTVYTYKAFTDSDPIYVTSKTQINSDALYLLNDDGSVSTAVSSTSSGVITAINGNVITIDGATSLNMVDSTVEIYTGEDVELKVGQTITYKANAVKTTNLDYVIVTADQGTVTYSITEATTATYELIKGAGVVNTVKVTIDLTGHAKDEVITFTKADKGTGATGGLEDGAKTYTITEDDEDAGEVTLTLLYTAPDANVTETFSIASSNS